MIIDCIADLHGAYPKLAGGDLLIMAGDYTTQDSYREWIEFMHWLAAQNYQRILWIGGNHDNTLAQLPKTQLVFLSNEFPKEWKCEASEYLCDTTHEFEGLKIYGSPWTLEFEGMNPKCKAFTVKTEEELEEKWKKIPWDTDILITHSPAHGWFDKVQRLANCGLNTYPRLVIDHCGSPSLQEKILNMLCLKLHVCGHIHEGYGSGQLIKKPKKGELPIQLVNASIMNERYEPINEPIRVIL